MAIQYYSEKEVAEKLRLSTSTLQKYRWKGIGPKFIKLGTKVLYPSNELEIFIEKHPVIQSTSQHIKMEGG